MRQRVRAACAAVLLRAVTLLRAGRPIVLSAILYLWRELELRDLIAGAGLIVVTAGISRLSTTAAWIFAGAVLLYIGLWHSAFLYRVTTNGSTRSD